MASKTNMEETIRVLREDNEAMAKEITSLKRQMGGCKGRNKQLTERIEDLKRDADIYAAHVKHVLDEKDKLINGLETQVIDLRNIITDRNNGIKNLKDELATTQANYDYYVSLPWYKRIFFVEK